MILKITEKDERYIDELIRYIRKSDVEEYEQTGLEESFSDAVYLSVRNSEECYCLFDKKHRVIAIYGVSEPVVTGGRLIWALGTDLIDKNKRTFGRESKRAIARWKKKYNCLWNVVAVSNKTTVKWLAWLGVEFGRETEINGNMFIPFCLSRGDD